MFVGKAQEKASVFRTEKRRRPDGYLLDRLISVFFYRRVVVMMYMADRDAAPVPAPVTGVDLAALTVATVAIFYLGILPTAFIDLAAASIATIF